MGCLRYVKEFFVSDYRERVGVLVLRDGDVLFVQQYRFLLDRLTWKIRDDGVDDGETPN